MYNFTLYMTTDCNFKCQYCYEDYHNHYQLNEKTLVDSLEFMMNYGDRGKVLIDFLGGEPLLKKDLIYKAVAYIKDNYPEREVKYYITTNCSMMDDRFIAFMKENHFTVRLSFDGNKETHDLNRVAKDGVSCYEKIFENIMKVKDSGLNFSVRMTVTENTIPYMFENICYLHEHGLDNICMIMDVYLKICDELKAEFEKQVGQILRYYLAEAAAGRVFTIDQFDGKMFNMLCDFGNCFGMCDAGIGNFKIFPNGQIYPCGFLTSNEKYCIGNIKEGVDIRKAKLIAMSNFDKTDPKCKGCTIRDFCHEKDNTIYFVLQVISILIFLFGVINLINTTLSNQLFRRREYSVLRSIGLTEKQLYKVIIGEGMCYSILSICMTLLIGTPIAMLICRQMSISCYGKVVEYSFPFFYMGIYVLVLLLIQVILSIYQIREQKKKSIIDQLRME